MSEETQKSSRPLIRDVMKRELIFPPQEKDLPLVLLGRPHAYVVMGRIIGLFLKYLKLLLIYKYNKRRKMRIERENKLI
ncbi:MAG: hypothetical protein WAZ12_01455 [Candidatus Absconditicoccaceae bacterium]